VARKQRPMDEGRLRAILDAEISNSIGFFGGDLSEERRAATKSYLGDTTSGRLTLLEGRSEVVDTVVRDSIEWLLPTLLRAFTASDRYVQFDANSQEDEDAAEQETDAVNHVVMKQNSGFSNFYTWIKDALLYKNGFIKFYWDDSGEDVFERYHGITPEELTALRQEEADGDIVIESTDEQPDPDFQTMMEMAAQQGRDLSMEMQMQGLPIPSIYDVELTRTVNGPGIKIEPIPPEEFLISPRSKSIKEAPFVAHRTRVMASDLIADGYDPEIVDRLPSFDEGEYSEERTARYATDEEWPRDASSSIDTSTRYVWVTEVWIRVDYDGDGIAELRRIKVAGSGASEILENDRSDFCPIASLTPIPVQHKFFGLSIADLVSDIQDIKSVLLRSFLDNLYFANNGRWEVPDAALTDETIGQLLSPRPGGFVRTKEAGMLKSLDTPIVLEPALAGLEVMQSMKEERTGVTRYNQGMDAASLNKTATGVAMIQRAANARVDLIARVFAETGVKDLMLGVHRLLRLHSDEAQEISYRLRGEWVAVDPSEWHHRTDMSINVGLGTEDKDRMLMHLNMIAERSTQLVQAQGGMKGPFIYPTQVYNLLEDMVANAELPGDRYFHNPKNEPEQLPQHLQQFMQPQPDAQMALVQGEMQIRQQEVQLRGAEVQMKAKEKQAEVQLRSAEVQLKAKESEAKDKAAAADQKRKMMEMMLKHELAIAEMRKEEGTDGFALKEQELREEIRLDREKLAAELQMDREKLAADIELQRDKLMADTALKRREIAEKSKQSWWSFRGKQG